MLLSNYWINEKFLYRCTYIIEVLFCCVKGDKFMKQMTLRKLEDRDAPFMLEWMRDPDINKCFRKPFKSATMESVLNFIHNSFDDENQHFAIVDEYGQYLGTISLKDINHNDNCAEYAIVVRKCVKGEGNALKATQELFEYAKNQLHLHRIYLNVLAENKRARMFYETCGYDEVGREREAVMIEGQYKDLMWYNHIL